MSMWVMWVMTPPRSANSSRPGVDGVPQQAGIGVRAERREDPVAPAAAHGAGSSPGSMSVTSSNGGPGSSAASSASASGPVRSMTK